MNTKFSHRADLSTEKRQAENLPMNVTYPTPHTVNEARRRTLDDPYGRDNQLVSISYQHESPYPVTQIKQRSMTNFYSKANKYGNNSILKELVGA